MLSFLWVRHRILTYHEPIRSLQEADDVEWRPLLHTRQIALQSAPHLHFLPYSRDNLGATGIDQKAGLRALI